MTFVQKSNQTKIHHDKLHFISFRLISIILMYGIFSRRNLIGKQLIIAFIISKFVQRKKKKKTKTLLEVYYINTNA